MYRKSASRLEKESKTSLKKWLSSFDTVLTDCDGVLWLHNEPIAGSAEALSLLQELGKQVFLVTNNSQKTRLEIRQKALRMGVYIDEDHIVCPAHTVARYLSDHSISGPVYVIGEPSIGHELDALSICHSGIGPDVMPSSLSGLIHEVVLSGADVSAVVVGFDKHFSFPKMLKAAQYLKQTNCMFIATNNDDQLMLPGGIAVPEAGPIVAAVSVAARRTYELVGKPNRLAYEMLEKNHEIVPERTLMIGDRCDTDILFGVNCGFSTLLVGTGINSMDDVHNFIISQNFDYVPDLFVDKLGVLSEILRDLKE